MSISCEKAGLCSPALSREDISNRSNIIPHTFEHMHEHENTSPLHIKTGMLQHCKISSCIRDMCHSLGILCTRVVFGELVPRHLVSLE